jgi:hypothetical protein
MNRTKALAVGSLLGLLAMAFLPRMQADEWYKTTKMTLNESVAIPGKVLQPGEYWLRLAETPSNRNIVQIWNEDQSRLEAQIVTVPIFRLVPLSDTRVTYWERPVGRAPALKAWYYPGESFGRQFAYPEDMATQLAQANQERVPAVAGGTVTTVTPTPERPGEFQAGATAVPSPPECHCPCPEPQAAPIAPEAQAVPQVQEAPPPAAVCPPSATVTPVPEEREAPVMPEAQAVAPAPLPAEQMQPGIEVIVPPPAPEPAPEVRAQAVPEPAPPAACPPPATVTPEAQAIAPEPLAECPPCPPCPTVTPQAIAPEAQQIPEAQPPVTPEVQEAVPPPVPEATTAPQVPACPPCPPATTQAAPSAGCPPSYEYRND